MALTELIKEMERRIQDGEGLDHEEVRDYAGDGEDASGADEGIS